MSRQCGIEPFHQRARRADGDCRRYGPFVGAGIGRRLVPGLGARIRVGIRRLGRKWLWRRLFRCHPALGDVVAFGLAEQVDIPDDHRRVVGDRTQNTQQPRRERRHRLRIEQIRRIIPRQRQPTGRILTHGQLHIELRRGHRHIHHRELQARQHHSRRITGAGRLERQRHLEQRMPRLRPHRRHHIHQLLERHISMRERRHIHRPHPPQQALERLLRRHLRPQHQRVHEHPHHIIQSTITTTGDRRPHRDVPAPGQSGRPHRQHRMHHHEQRHPTRLRHLRQTRMQPRIHGEHMHRTGIRRHLRTRPIRRQLDLLRHPRQPIHPIRHLPRRQRTRILDRTQDFPLPHRVIRILHRQRRPHRHLTGRPRTIRSHHIPQQRPQRETVTGNVMQHQHHHMHRFGAPHPEQCGTERDIRGHIERICRHFGCPREQFVRTDRLGYRLQLDIGHREHALIADSVEFRVDRAQGFVARHHIP
ncbi:hypothetical protein NRB56_76120 [Nocardia sp. RB56]|uniref:Uncharacterized protein n=1 Tax=Nocardia aurantia TaxID=2585199 RepID=A0A7K0E1P4_9NOCA|nr:hypothetical protein [Nocardia aurantia]